MSATGKELLVGPAALHHLMWLLQGPHPAHPAPGLREEKSTQPGGNHSDGSSGDTPIHALVAICTYSATAVLACAFVQLPLDAVTRSGNCDGSDVFRSYSEDLLSTHMVMPVAPGAFGSGQHALAA